jgi:type II secretory pathway component PulM
MMQITRRERLLAVGLTTALGVWGLYAVAIRPATDRIRTLQRVIPEKQAQLQDLQTRSAQYTALRSQCDQVKTQMAAQDPNFEITRFLETTIDQHKLAKHVVTMSPDTVQPQSGYSEIVVTIELHEISLKQLTYFLTALETSKSLVRVSTLHIRSDPKNETLLDSTVGVSSPKLGQAALATQTGR